MDQKAFNIRFTCVALASAAADAALTFWLLQSGKDANIARGIALLLISFVSAPLFRRVVFGGRELKESGVLFSAAAFLDFVVYWKLLRILGPAAPEMQVFTALTGGAVAGALLKYMMFKPAIARQEEAAIPATAGQHKKNLRLAVWLVIACGIGWRSFARQLDLLAGRPVGPSDPDTWLRLTQVRHWLTGGGFYNHAVVNTNAPFGGIETHWTRPVDALLSIFYAIAPHNLDINSKLMFAANWLPGFLCLGAIFCISRSARFQSGSFHALAVSALLVFFGTLSATQFAPGIADHHGVLCVLWCGMLALLFSATTPTTSFLLGAVMGAAVWVSPEALLPAACLLMLSGALALYAPSRINGLALSTAAATIVVVAGVLVERPVAQLMLPVYDQVSVVHVMLFGLSTAAAAVLCVIFRSPRIQTRAFASVAALAAIAGGMAVFYPKFFKGPFVDSDAYVTENLLPAITQAQPLFDASFPDICRALLLPLAAVILMGSCWHKDMVPAKRRQMTALASLLSLSLGMTLWQLRWQYYMQPVAIIIIASLLPAAARAARPGVIQRLKEFPALWRPYMVLWVIILLTMGIGTLDDKPESAACSAAMRAQIQQGWLEEKLGDKALILAAPSDVSGQLLFFTPYKIIAGNYHREAKGLQDLDVIFKSAKADEAHKKLKERKTAALFYCPSATQGGSWLAGKKPAWLQPVADDTTIVYKVR
jgi:hypothetical protein